MLRRAACSLLTLTQPHVNGPGTLPNQQRAHVVCAGFITTCENIFPCFRCNEYSSCLCLSMCVSHMASGQFHLFAGRGQGPFIAATEGWAKVNCALCRPLREICWPWGTNAQDWSWSCSVSSLCIPSSALTVFSLVTQTPRCNGVEGFRDLSWDW